MCITITLNSEGKFIRIEDNLCKAIAGGRWVDTIFNISNNSIIPVLVWYEKFLKLFVEPVNLA